MLFLFSLGAGPSVAANLINGYGEGFVDKITISNNRVDILGWAAPYDASQKITSINILFDNTPVYKGAFARLQRPDVVLAYARPLWNDSGWQVSFKTPDELNEGIHAVTAQAQTSAGQWIPLAISDAAKIIQTSPGAREEKILIRNVKIVIACALLFLVICFLKASSLTLAINTRFKLSLSEPVIFTGCVLLVSFLFVSLGLTGSSLGLGQPNTPFVQINSTQVLGHNQGVRSDEWLVLTPFAIAQYNHKPKNPILNKNLGEDGQNMLIVGMTGAPVAHISAIAKPATWGYFVFDLKRALSWNWCFPIVGCFLALAFVLNRLSDGHWKHGFLFSALFCCAPYVVAWSNWPAYVIFFPCVIFLCALQILKTYTAYKLVILGAVMGIAMAGYVFVLYPAWQVSVGYVFVAITANVVIREKLYNALNGKRILAYAFAMSLAGVVVGLWWVDAKPAIELMERTVYPGQRITTGGIATLPSLLRGFTNITTLYKLDSSFSNQSEIASFYYFFLPLLMLFVIHLLQKTVTSLEWVLLSIILFILFYMFYGIPLEWARYSLWGRVPPLRADLALGLSCTLLTYVLFIRKHEPIVSPTLINSIAMLAALAWAYVVYHSMRQLAPSILADFNAGITTALLIVATAIGYCLITDRLKTFICLSLGLSFATTASFNPINIAPTQINVRLTDAKHAQLANLLSKHRVLVLENTVTTMFLLASGVPVANGIFYYPQKTLWSRLDPSGVQADTYNRYMHLTYLSALAPAKDYVLGTPRADVVTVTVNLETFNFIHSGAGMVTATDSHRDALDNNPSLSFIMSVDGWSWYTTTTF